MMEAYDSALRAVGQLQAALLIIESIKTNDASVAALRSQAILVVNKALLEQWNAAEVLVRATVQQSGAQS